MTGRKKQTITITSSFSVTTFGVIVIIIFPLSNVTSSATTPFPSKAFSAGKLNQSKITSGA